jgi:hypothetical protein
MRQYSVPRGDPKGWLAGPWESSLAVSIGYASEGIDEPHVHPDRVEVDLVVRGTAQLHLPLRVRHRLSHRSGSALKLDLGMQHPPVRPRHLGPPYTAFGWVEDAGVGGEVIGNDGRDVLGERGERFANPVRRREVEGILHERR